MKPVEAKKDGNGRDVMPITQHLFGVMKYKDNPRVEVKSIADEIVPRFVHPLEWRALPRHRNVVVEYEAAERLVGALDEDTQWNRKLRLVQFLVMPVYDVQPGEAHIKKFGLTLRRLMDEGIPKGVLADPFFMSLNGADGRPKGVLGTYLAVDMSQDDLNAFLGFYGFVKESEVPTVEWP